MLVLGCFSGTKGGNFNQFRFWIAASNIAGRVTFVKRMTGKKEIEEEEEDKRERSHSHLFPHLYSQEIRFHTNVMNSYQ